MNRLFQHVLNLVRLVASQAIVLGGFTLFYKMGGRLPLGLPELLLIQGLLAALVGRLLGLWWFWIPVQILLPIAAVYNDVLPAWVYAVAFAAAALIFWNGATEQVPFYMTNRRTWATLGNLVAKAGAKRIVDLGSGLGGIVAYLARTNPANTVEGVETAPLLVLASKLRLALARLPNGRILYRSLWSADLSGYDLVYCFLSPVPMADLYAKAKQEMRAGTLFVSNSFEVPDVTPERIVTVDDARQTRLFLYRM